MKRVVRGIVTCIFACMGIYLLWLWFQLLFTKPILALGIAAVLGISALLVRFQDRSERQRALKHMHGRPPLTNAEFGHHYFPTAQADIAAQVRDIFARHISVDVSQAHPDDKVVEDLRMDSLDSMSTVEFVLELEKHFKISISNTAAAQMRTLRDVTSFISQELQAPNH